MFQPPQRYLCPVHSKDIELICKTCRQSACVVCLVATHNRHDMMLASERVEANKRVLSKMIASNDEKIKELDVNIMKIQEEITKEVVKEIKNYLMRAVDDFLTSKLHPYLKPFQQLRDNLTDYKHKLEDVKYLTDNEVVEDEVLVDFKITKKFEYPIYQVDYQKMQDNFRLFPQIFQNSIKKICVGRDFVTLVKEIKCGVPVTCFTISNDKLYIFSGNEFITKDLLNPEEVSTENIGDGFLNLGDILSCDDNFYYYYDDMIQNIFKEKIYSPIADLSSRMKVNGLEFLEIRNINCFSLAGKNILAASNGALYEIESNSLQESSIFKSFIDMNTYIFQVLKMNCEKLVIASESGLGLFICNNLYKNTPNGFDLDLGQGAQQTLTWQELFRVSGVYIFRTRDGFSDQYTGMTKAYLSHDIYDNIYVISDCLQSEILILDKNLKYFLKIQTFDNPKKTLITSQNILYVSYVGGNFIAVYKIKGTETEESLCLETENEEAEA
ncbi:hypothetical protein HELRODRAFT_176601 [Helobdella robusta]|uniref:B box-type domain-containing protein n=1 Tax=Helobdella robusta TaxID=6412 RepID=T1FAP8_HELRO|nr:hypothetical protein HELRODRAFT_176601 [Helobdella robusta]ESN99836.1 hypothetical protein HELRODRAFT_176601 [Helobdella robusta]